MSSRFCASRPLYFIVYIVDLSPYRYDRELSCRFSNIRLERKMLRRAFTTAATRTRAVKLSDYAPFPFTIDSVHLDFKLGSTTEITSTLVVSKASLDSNAVLSLDGQDLSTVDVQLSGSTLTEGKDYTITTKPDGDNVMSIYPPPHDDPFEVRIKTLVEPAQNTKLEGLYQSSGTYCTQCEAEGFRRITWYPDRPDVMSTFKVTLTGDKNECPVLLSNGNLVESFENVKDNTHTSVWVDPFRKPAYLFAVVAGDLVALEDTYTTTPSNRQVALKIWTQAHNADKTEFAMQSLQDSFKWDEDRFRLEYDLDIFQIVAVDDFNMGAMENKSLNVFNSRLVLATPDTATDTDYERIQGVVGHEYFHNWTGNRVTCRDWFQLSLKEGLTVFRDQEFTSDLNSRAVKRIADVRLLRAAQFPEDAGAMAHPVRPSSYEKIDNFYSVTVYEKGAELIRMYHTLLGEAVFQKGIDLYFERFDGQAVTTDDFYGAMDDASGNDKLGKAFQRWYDQAGTPQVTVTWENQGNQGLVLKVVQQIPSTADVGGDVKRPVCIPLAVGFLDAGTGEDVRLNDAGETTVVLKCDQEISEFVFEDLSSSSVVPSLLRNFSAPVRLCVPQLGQPELSFLLRYDSDPFNRSEAARNLMESMVVAALSHSVSGGVSGGLSGGEEWSLGAAGFEDAVEGLVAVLNDDALDPAFRALVLEPPSTSELVDGMEDADPLAVHEARRKVVEGIAERMGHQDCTRVYEWCCAKPGLDSIEDSVEDSVEGYVWNPENVGKRSLAARCLKYMMSMKDQTAGKARCLAQFKSATNMTDSFNALAAMNGNDCWERNEMMNEFLKKWSKDPNVVVKYLLLESTTDIPNNAERLRHIFEAGTGAGTEPADASVAAVAAAFDITMPNKVYALCRAFSASNVNFHAVDGSGYRLMADMILAVDKVNAQVGSRLASPFTKWLKYDVARRVLMKMELERMMGDGGLSPNTLEIVSKCLKQEGGRSKM